ncbi:adenylate kinase [Thermodesulfobacteriota bacterium]
MKANLLFLGPQGCGKGTVIGRIKDAFELPHISTGDMFRDAIRQGTELGKKAKGFMDSGALVPDEVTIGLVEERLAQADCEKGFFLDGFPRTLAQAEALANRVDVTGAILLDVPDEVSIQRLSGRRQCRDCGAIFHLAYLPPKIEGVCDKCSGELYQRDDDKPEAISERLALYHNDTLPVVEFFKAKGVLHTIDATRPPETNAADVKAIVESLISG